MAKEDYKEIEQDIVDFIKETEKEFNIPIDIGYKYLLNDKQKQMIKFVKIPDAYASEPMLNADILVTVNNEYFDNFDDDIKKILVEKEFDKIDFNFEKGTIKVSKPKVDINTGFVEKHTWEAVSNAVKLEKEFEEQRKDKSNN
jgi:hypothetical protein